MKPSDDELLGLIEKKFKEIKKVTDENKKLMEQLWIANKKLEESEKMKSNFLSNIRNEIINPFSSILGLTKNILHQQQDKDKIISTAKLIHLEAFSLDFQFRNIFTAAEIEAGEVYVEAMKVDLKNLIESIVEMFRYEYDKKQLSVELQQDYNEKHDGTFYFISDADKLQTIFANLISNAVEFSNAGGKIIIKSFFKDNILHFSVQDSGRGIDKSNLKDVFDRFKRLDNSINTLNRGHGLGLSIVKSLLDLLNGKVDVITQKNVGSTFTIEIPEWEQQSDVEGFALDGNEFLFSNEEKF